MLRAALIAILLPCASLAQDITVFAAASLQTALDQIAADWHGKTGDQVVISYGGSASLAKQITAGAPADLFISAAENWMDVLEQEGLIWANSRQNLLGNDLVMIAHDETLAPIALDQSPDLAALLNGAKLAMGQIDSVPAGQYGHQALTHLGLWDQIASQVVQTENVRAALALVTLGEADFGIVYNSDAMAGNSHIIARFPPNSHAPVRYPAALIHSNLADPFLAYLGADQAKAIFAAQGFVVGD
jgi:molybdate transport system substrate-binding protein